MTTKGILGWVVVAAALGGAAYYLTDNGRAGATSLNGRRIVPDLDLEHVASINIGGTLSIAAGAKGWTLTSHYGYPASREKIAENLLHLTELKVGQVAHGRALGAETKVVLRDAAGRSLAELTLGDVYAGRFPGRYLKFRGETVLVADALDAFAGDDPKRWCDTRIGKTDLYFTRLVDPKSDLAGLGLTTGAVCSVSWKEGTNDVSAVAHLGGTSTEGDRYFQLEGMPWIYEISSYAADNLLKAADKTEKEESK